ncbi:MAG: TIM barrel protein [Syntrophorhabdales bacterium]|jgi:sugar phosphate isomerase/epimerase
MENFSIYRFMKLGIVHFKAYPEATTGEGPIVETLRKIVEDDFWTAVEVGWMKDPKVRHEARKLLETSHMEICYANQPRVFTNKLDLNSFDPKERKKAINAIKNGVDEAFQLGASCMRVFSGKHPGGEKKEEAKKILIDSLREVCQYTNEQGPMEIYMKVFDYDIDKCYLIGHFQDAADVTAVLHKEFSNFGVLADLSHFPLLRETPEQAIPLVKQYPMHFHIGNCAFRDKRHPGYGDLQPRFGMTGGEIDTPQVRDYFRLLLDLKLLNPDKRPVLSAEVRPLLAEDTSEVVIANTKRVIKEAWAMV